MMDFCLQDQIISIIINVMLPLKSLIIANHVRLR